MNSKNKIFLTAGILNFLTSTDSLGMENKNSNDTFLKQTQAFLNTNFMFSSPSHYPPLDTPVEKSQPRTISPQKKNRECKIIISPASSCKNSPISSPSYLRNRTYFASNSGSSQQSPTASYYFSLKKSSEIPIGTPHNSNSHSSTPQPYDSGILEIFSFSEHSFKQEDMKDKK